MSATDIVKAEVRSDDGVATKKFNARLWLLNASLYEIKQLIRDGWGGNYSADIVAEYMEDIDLSIKSFFDYIRAVNGFQEVGFECYVDAESALACLKEYRSDVYELVKDLEKEEKKMISWKCPSCGTEKSRSYYESEGKPSTPLCIHYHPRKDSNIIPNKESILMVEVDDNK